MGSALWFTGSGNSVDSERVRASVKEECAPALLGSGARVFVARNISVLAPNASVARRSDFHPGRPPELRIPRQFFPERHEV